MQGQHLLVKILANSDFIASFGVRYGEAIRDFDLFIFGLWMYVSTGNNIKICDRGKSEIDQNDN
jgi:hypothetical protein